jgi:hypothetical protein
MPRDEVLKLSSPQQIKERFGVSFEAAKIRYKQVIEKSQPRKLTDRIRGYLDERVPKFQENNKLSSYIPTRRRSKEDLVWDAATIAANHDPYQYRYSCRGTLVRHSEYLQQSHFGWFIIGDQIYAHRDTNSGVKSDDEICSECGNLTLRRDGTELKCVICGLKAQL